MTGFYDSSILLSAVLEERKQIDHSAYWDTVDTRLASELLRIECVIAIRRAAIMQNLDPADEWASRRVEELANYFKSLTFKTIDDAIIGIIRDTPSLARCRTLDAIHLATAMYFQPHLDEPLFVCSFDRRLREAAVYQGCQVIPESLESQGRS